MAVVAWIEDVGEAVPMLIVFAVFIPVLLMGGIVGRFMSSFGYTAAFAIMVSLLVSFTLTPMLCSRFLRVGTCGGLQHDPPHGRGVLLAELAPLDARLLEQLAVLLLGHALAALLDDGTHGGCLQSFGGTGG